MSIDPLLSSVFSLSPAEKLQLVQDLWDDLAQSPADVPVHDWQIEELDRRKAALKAAPQSAVSWEDAKKKIRDASDD